MAEQNPGGKGQPDRKRQDPGSGFDSAPAGPRHTGSMPALPSRAQPGSPSRSTTAAAMPRAASAPGVPSRNLPAASAPRPSGPAGAGSIPSAALAAQPQRVTGSHSSPGAPLSPENPAAGYQKQILASSFAARNERTQIDAMLGKAARPAADDDDDDEPTAIGFDFDGRTPAQGLTARDVWRAINAPVQSREGRRSADLYRLVIDQFAVGHNDRYAEDAPGKPRAHIFIWDVTRAMNAEVPHFAGAKELTLGQTVDWLRHEGPMRGWQRADAISAQEAANEGYPVLALPKEIRLKLIAVVRPGEVGSDGKPRLAAAAKGRGNDLSTSEALGVFAVEYFAHP